MLLIIMNSSIDLNIENYSYKDLLKLFHLEFYYSFDDLKQAKQIVYKTHPDKSRLPKEYFLFFSKAYKILIKLYSFRNKNTHTETTEYDSVLCDFISNDSENIATIVNQKKNSNFSKWFNETFETLYIQNESDSTGYGDWLKSNECINNNTVSNIRDLHNTIETKKLSIIKKEDVKSMNSTSGTLISTDAPTLYSSSDIFSKFQFEDVKKAHSETVIPVSKRDYDERTKYNNVTEMQFHRSEQDHAPISYKGEEYLKEQMDSETNISINNAFKMLKQEDIIKQQNKIFMSKLRQIRNN